MTILFLVPLVLSIILVSFFTWRVTGNAISLLARRVGARRTRMALAVLAVLTVAASGGATWLFARQSRQAAVQAGQVPAVAPVATLPGGDLTLLVNRLEERLQREPGDAQGWALLARTQLELQRFDAAARAYAKALAMLPTDADLFVEYANAELMAHGRQWTAIAVDATNAALALNPDHLEALWLAGAHQFEKKDFAAAVRSWEKLARVAPADSDYARDLATSLVEARALRDGRDPAAALAAAGAGARPLATGGTSALAATGASLVTEASSAISSVTSRAISDDKEALARELRGTLNRMAARPLPATPAAGVRVSGVVALPPGWRDRFPPDSTVFVFARAEGAARTGPPLAARRYRAADLPIRFELSDNDAMSPDHTLSSARRVVIVARISRSGDARVQAGDVEGTSGAIAVGADSVSVLIDKPL
ncbi:MAG: hypothetical protein ABI790_00880 [Betaproteobacteria bacterium]